MKPRIDVRGRQGRDEPEEIPCTWATCWPVYLWLGATGVASVVVIVWWVIYG